MPDKIHESSDPQPLKVNESGTETIKCYFNINFSDPCLHQSSVFASSCEPLKHIGKLQRRGTNPGSNYAFFHVARANIVRNQQNLKSLA